MSQPTNDALLARETPLGSRVDPRASTRPDSGEILRAGLGAPLLLFHGITCSAHVWSAVVPRLAREHEVIVPTALGHRGGARSSVRPVRIAHVVDDAERTLDRLGIARAHLAGNSMGGWVALELARRGRALSVCALSPAGAWRENHSVGDKLRNIVTLTRVTRPLLSLFAHSATFRRLAMRDNATYGDRIARAELLRLVDDLLGCEAASDLLKTNEALSELDVDCPTTIAWSENDRIFPIDEYLPIARQRVPRARFVVLKDVGHVPMLDNPELVADTILEACQTACGYQAEPPSTGVSPALRQTKPSGAVEARGAAREPEMAGAAKAAPAR